MKNLVKLFGIIVIAAVTGFSFAACGGAGDQTGPGDGGLSVEIDPALAGTAWKDNEGGTSLTVSFTSSGMTWGGALGRSIEMATAVNEGLVT